MNIFHEGITGVPHPDSSSWPLKARICSTPYINLLIAKLISISVTAHSESISKSCHSCLATFVLRFLLDHVSNRWRWNSYYLNKLNIKGTTAETGSAPTARSHARTRAQPVRASPSTAAAWRGPLHLPPLGEPTLPPRASLGPAPCRSARLSSPLKPRQSRSPAGLHFRVVTGRKNQRRACSLICAPIFIQPRSTSPRRGGRTGARGRGAPSSDRALLQRSSGPAPRDGAQLGGAREARRHGRVPYVLTELGQGDRAGNRSLQIASATRPSSPLAAPHADSSSSLA